MNPKHLLTRGAVSLEFTENYLFILLVMEDYLVERGLLKRDGISENFGKLLFLFLEGMFKHISITYIGGPRTSGDKILNT